MTAAAQPTARPAKPRASPVVPIGIAVFVVITWASLSEQLGIGFDIGHLASSITNGAGIIGELLSPNWAFLPRTLDDMLETFQIAVVASAIGCLVALPVAFLASRVTSPNAPTLVAARSVLSVVRAIPDILYALIFVASTGPRPCLGCRCHRRCANSTGSPTGSRPTTGAPTKGSGSCRAFASARS